MVEGGGVDSDCVGRYGFLKWFLFCGLLHILLSINNFLIVLAIKDG